MMVTPNLAVGKHSERAAGPGGPGGQAGVLGHRAAAAYSRPSWEAGLGWGADVQEAAGSTAGPQETQLLPSRSPPLSQH